MSVAEGWSRLAAWVAAPAPATAASIRPPASEATRRAAEREAGGSWPADLVDWFALHDGCERNPDGYLLPGQRLLPARELAETWRMQQDGWALIRRELAPDPDQRRCDAALFAAAGVPAPPRMYDVDRLESEPAGSPAAMFLPSFVPISEDHDGSYLVVDLRPGDRRGCVTSYDKVDADDEGTLWPSIVAMLDDVATTLEEGGRTGYWLPHLDGDRLAWRVVPPG